MKALFIVFHGFAPSNGIVKKVTAQVKALNLLGLNTSLCNYSVQENGDRCWLIDGQILDNFGSGLRAKLKKRFYYDSIYRYVVEQGISFIYIRSDHNASPFLIGFINRIKRKGIKVVMEIPTYPYDNEYKGIRLKMNLFIDRLFRKQLAQKLDAIVTFSDKNEIFGQKTICVSNGIDFDTISLKKIHERKKNELHLIGVAEIHYWHGFDRIIAGMGDYYKANPECKIYFHLVGDFAETYQQEKCHQLIKDGELTEYVILHGSKFGEELDSLFNQADFAIGSLARHRSGITCIKTLKNREYAARGISFIYSETDEDFDSMPYVLKAIPNESNIDINKIIEFYKGLSFTPEEIRESITGLSWKEQMKKVVEQINIYL